MSAHRIDRDRRAGLARATLAVAALSLATAPADAGPRDPLYRWSDGDGNVRYTTDLERIPVIRRSDAVEVVLPAEPEPPLPSFAPGPGTVPSPSPLDEDALAPVESPGAASGPRTGAPTAPSALDARIAELEREIAENEALLTATISDPERSAQLGTSEEITAIAERLPRLQAELRALRASRDAAAADAP